MSNYTRGRAVEYRFMHKLKAQGYTAVRASGSHGDFDVLAYKDKGTMQMFQIKLSLKGKAIKKDIERFNSSPIPARANGYLLCYKKGTSNPTEVYKRLRWKKQDYWNSPP